MGAGQIFNPMEGINRMVADIESFLQPIIFKIHPILHLLSKINLQLIITVFIGLSIYLFVIKKHRIIRRFRDRETYIFSIIGLILFYVLSLSAIPLGPNIKFNFGLVVMPVIAKFFGPTVSLVFGLCQYFVQFLNVNGLEFSLAMMLTGAISGMLYALFLYDRRTKYVRCFLAKLFVNIICNILLVPLATQEAMTTDMAKEIAEHVIENIFLVPFQALAIYIALRLIRKIRRNKRHR